MKNKCYKCGKPIKKGQEYYYPVLESMKDVGSPPKAPFCKECFMVVAEPEIIDLAMSDTGKWD